MSQKKKIEPTIDFYNMTVIFIFLERFRKQFYIYIWNIFYMWAINFLDCISWIYL